MEYEKAFSIKRRPCTLSWVPDGKHLAYGVDYILHNEAVVVVDLVGKSQVWIGMPST
jgi:hypothetical protein